MTEIEGASSLSNALYRLVYHRTVRHLFSNGDFSRLELSKQDEQELSTIDLLELEATARTIARNMLAGNSGGSGGLRQSFPMTLALLEDAGISAMEVMYRFLEAPAFRLYRELPYAGVGLSAEEAFEAFVQSHDGFVHLNPLIGPMAQHEMLTALLSILVVTTQPSFIIKSPLVHNNGRCRFACVLYPRSFLDSFRTGTGEGSSAEENVWYLYAATGTHFMHGPVTTLIAIIMDTGSLSDVIARSAILAELCELPSEVVVATAEALQQRGLIL